MKLKKLKGFALTQILLAVALGAVLSLTTLAYFKSQHKNEVAETSASLILDSNNKSIDNSGVVVKTTTNGMTVLSKNGLSTVSSKDCLHLSNKMKSYGGKVSACDSKGSFTYNRAGSVNVAQVTNAKLTEGTPDNFVQQDPNAVALAGNVAVRGLDSVSVGTVSTTFGSSGSSLSGSSSLAGGAGGSVTSGSPPTKPSGGSTCAAGATYIGSTGTASNPWVKSMNAGINAYILPATGSSCGPTNASGQVDITYLGKTQRVSVHCSGIDKVTHTSTDMCNNTVVVSVAGGSFKLDLQASSRFRQDVAMPGLCPAYANLRVTQLAKAPGC